MATPTLPSLRILAVEDDKLQARALRLHLLALGYDPPLEAASAEQAEALFEAEKPDLVLLDIHLGAGSPDGITLAGRLRQKRATPFIFLTSAHDLATFERASAANPHAFLTKPYDRDALFRAIELAARQHALVGGHLVSEPPGGSAVPRPLVPDVEPEQAPVAPPPPVPTPPGPPPDHLWLRDGSRMVRAALADILCVEADDSYSHFFTAQGRKYTVRQSLRDLEGSLPPGQFLRIHRGYLAQISRIDSVDLPNATVSIGEHTLPLGRAYREELVKRLGLVG